MATKKTEASLYLEEVLSSLGLSWTAELRFHTLRRWRVDYAVENEPRVAIEIEGGTWRPGGSRHTSPVGYVKEMEKYNALSLAGWRLLRYTPAQILGGLAEKEVRQLYDMYQPSTNFIR